MPLTALDDGAGAEDGLECLTQPLGPVDDVNQPFCVAFGAQPAVHQLLEERRTHPLVLGGRLDEAEKDLFPRHGDAQGDGDFVGRPGFPVKSQGHELVPL